VSIIKNLLKGLKLHESTISTILGFLVIIVVGLLVVNYFRNLDTGEAFPTSISTEEEARQDTYTVAAGDSLWTISEKVYGTGYNWVDIRDANNVENPNDIEEGQVLIIPEVGEEQEVELAEATASPEPVVSASPTPLPTLEGEVAAYAGGTYTVIRGDNLWNIAVEVYGDGFRWVDIAEANHLVNPSIIHAGNALTIPA
jgi:nucleoid-associated protein YgaU